MRALLTFTTIGLLLLTLQAQSAPSSVELEALLGKTAVLMINGERKTLRVGESFAGVTLVAAQTTTATLSIDGREQTVGLSQRVATEFQQAQEHVVTIPRDAMMQYQKRYSRLERARGASLDDIYHVTQAAIDANDA